MTSSCWNKEMFGCRCIKHNWWNIHLWVVLVSQQFSEHQGNYVLSQVEVMMTVLFVCLGKATMKTTEITTCVNKHKRLKLHFYIFLRMTKQIWWEALVCHSTFILWFAPVCQLYWLQWKCDKVCGEIKDAESIERIKEEEDEVKQCEKRGSDSERRFTAEDGVIIRALRQCSCFICSSSSGVCWNVNITHGKTSWKKIERLQEQARPS